VKAVQAGYALAQCVQCNFVWDPEGGLKPTVVYEENYYHNENFKGGYANYSEAMQVNAITFRRRLQEASRKQRKVGALLDVGCALGDCLKQAVDLGWPDPKGLEVSRFAVESAKKKNLTVFQGSLLSHPFAPGSFDVILMQDVIEHVPDPVAHLKEAYALLKPGGMIMLTTPDVGGLWSQILGGRWYHYKPGEHLVYFSRSTMSLALANAGFGQIETESTSNYLSVGYVLNRLQYYHPKLFSWVATAAKHTSVDRLALWLRIGELEAWAWKPNPARHLRAA